MVGALADHLREREADCEDDESRDVRDGAPSERFEAPDDEGQREAADGGAHEVGDAHRGLPLLLEPVHDDRGDGEEAGEGRADGHDEVGEVEARNGVDTERAKMKKPAANISMPARITMRGPRRSRSHP